MRFINSKIHAIADYASGVLMLSLPLFINLSSQTNATTIALVTGIFILLLSILTRYEGGLIPTIPLYAHLGVDIVIGLALIVIVLASEFTGAINYFFWLMGAAALFFGCFTVLRPVQRRKFKH